MLITSIISTAAKGDAHDDGNDDGNDDGDKGYANGSEPNDGLSKGHNNAANKEEQ